jgi:hypothetical protein
MKKLCLFFAFMLAAWMANGQLTAPGYTNYDLSGFNVLVQNTAFQQNNAKTQQAIALLGSKLTEITTLCLSGEIIAKLKTVPIFVDWNTSGGAAVYHPDLAWLLANGYIPEKEKSVEISNIDNFINWTTQNQPYMVLHELAHAYDDMEYGFDNPLIAAAYNNAVSSGLYLNVQYHHGGGVYSNQPSAYALTNKLEYFAELTEAYFGLNDYYPFNKAQLETYDPLGYSALQTIWEPCSPSSAEERVLAPAPDVYPNPARGKFFVKPGIAEGGEYQVNLYDLYGKRVYAAERAAFGAMEIEVSHLSPAMYVVELIGREGRSVRRVMVY